MTTGSHDQLTGARCATASVRPYDAATVGEALSQVLAGNVEAAACAAYSAGGRCIGRQTAESGDAASQVRFGARALKWAGTPRNPVLARAMLERAARQRDMHWPRRLRE